MKLNHLPPPKIRLNPELPVPKVPPRPLPSALTLMSPRLPGAPSTQRLPPRRTNEVLACFSLLRLTSTKRISVCTWFGSSSAAPAVNAGAPRVSTLPRPSTSTRLRNGSGLQPVQISRLVEPCSLPVTRKPRRSSNCTSAIFGSPMASRSIGTARRRSRCCPGRRRPAAPAPATRCSPAAKPVPAAPTPPQQPSQPARHAYPGAPMHMPAPLKALHGSWRCHGRP